MFALIATELGQYVLGAYAGYCVKQGHIKRAVLASTGIVVLEVTQIYLIGKGVRNLTKVNTYKIIKPKGSKNGKTTNGKNRS